jgi:hypothetical protein
MMNSPKNILGRTGCAIFACLGLAGHSGAAFSWDHEGHTAIGVMAVAQLEPAALEALQSIVKPLTKQAMAEACSWPDDLRETEEGEWSSALHYINIPRGDAVYSVERDCPKDPDNTATAGHPPRQCATEAIKYFAAAMADMQAPPQQRWQSFAWLCHLVGDLHQPLHAGFGDDRGGNNFDVVFNDEPMDLHDFWDAALILQQAGSWQYLVGALGVFPPSQAPSGWSPAMVDDWTNESHRLVIDRLYPATARIDAVYAQESWGLIQSQMTLAANRLASIINTQLPGTQ